MAGMERPGSVSSMATEGVLPIIDDQACTGCGECVARCPAHALDLGDGKATLVAPEMCSYCAECQDVCPAGAIALPYEIVFESETG